jgi:hypothetical protein
MQLTDWLLVEVELLLIGLTKVFWTKSGSNHPSLIEKPAEYIQYRGRIEIGGMYLPSQLERRYTTTLNLMVDKVKEGGRAPHTLTSWADVSIRWNVQQKVAIATLCVLCGITSRAAGPIQG